MNKSIVKILFLIYLNIGIYEILIAISEAYILSNTNIIPMYPKTECDRNLSAFTLITGFDFFTSFLSFGICSMYFCYNQHFKNLTEIINYMALGQTFQFIFGYLF